MPLSDDVCPVCNMAGCLAEVVDPKRIQVLLGWWDGHSWLLSPQGRAIVHSCPYCGYLWESEPDQPSRAPELTVSLSPGDGQSFVWYPGPTGESELVLPWPPRRPAG